MYVCVCMYINICIYIYIHTYIYIYIYIKYVYINRSVSLYKGYVYAYRYTHSYINPPKHPYTNIHTHMHTQSFEFPFVLNFITLIPPFQGVGSRVWINCTTSSLLQTMHQFRGRKNLPSTFLTHLNPPVQRPLVVFFFKCIKLKKVKKLNNQYYLTSLKTSTYLIVRPELEVVVQTPGIGEWGERVTRAQTLIIYEGPTIS